MTKTPYTKRVLIIVTVIGIVFWFSKSYFHPAKPLMASKVSVTTDKVTQRDVTLTAHAIGNVQPQLTVAVKSRVEGQLLSVGFKEGDYIKKDQIIFQIDPHPYKVALEQAKANLARDQAQLENLQKLLERYSQLVKKGYISKQDFDAADANVKAQVATVMADKSAVDNAQLNLDYCTIHAPISGRTGKVLVNEGNLIKVNDSSPLVIINQIKPIYVVFSLPEHELENVKEEFAHGAVPVAIQSKNLSKTYLAQLSFIDNTVDPTTGMIQLKAVFANNQEEIWPGQYVDVTLPTAKVKKALLVPTRSIQAGPTGPYIFAVKADSHVTVKPVTVGPVIADDTIIQGLSADTVIVTTGQSQLVEGSVVQTQIPAG